MSRLFCLGLALLSTITCVLAQTTGSAPPSSSPSRLAIISTADTADLAALVTAELSGNPNISLVERTDLAKVGDELKLQQLAGTDAAALGKLVNADGLLFLGKEGDAVHARLTAVGLGYSVFDLQIAPGVDPNELAKSMGHRVSQSVPKLKLTAIRAIPISILNLRSDLMTPNSSKIERDLTLLLESRLASVPEYVVLERRHAWDLGFEHSLITSPDAPQLLEGAYVLDGILRITEANGGAIHVDLRLRAPKSSQETPLQADGKFDDLPGLVETLVAQVNKAIGSPTSASVWQPQTEAREYLHEGIWAWEHGQPQASVEALDSAELLGETAPDLLAARIQSLCQLVVPDLNPAEIDVIGDPGIIPTVFGHVNTTHYYTPRQPLPDRLALAKRAMADYAVYRDPSGRSYHLQFLDPKWQHAVQLGITQIIVTHAASSVLAELDEKNDPEAATFREQVRQFVGFDPLNAKIPMARGDGAFFADEWANSQDEEIAYYRSILSATKPQDQSSVIFLKSRFLWEKGAKFCPRFIKDPKDQRKAYLDFMQSLAQTPAGKLSESLVLSGDQDPSVSEVSYPAFLDELANQGAELIQDRTLPFQCEAAFQLPAELREKFGSHAISMLRQYLTQSNVLDMRVLQVLWVPSSFPPGDAPAIWKEFKDYKARILKTSDSGSGYGFQNERVLGMFESAFIKAFPSFAETAQNPLAVTKFWQPGIDENTGKFFYINSCKVCADTAALRGFYPGENHDQKIYLLQLPDFKSEKINLPKDYTAYEYGLTPDALFVTGFKGEISDGKAELYRWDRTQESWEEHDTPPSYAQPYIVHDQIYLNLNNTNGQDSAIARYDWSTQNLVLVASARRRPAQNQFDDRRGFLLMNLFPGFHDTVGVNIDRQCFIISEQPGDWHELIPGFAQMSFSVGDKTLLEDYKEHLCFLIDPAKAQPEILLAQPDVPLAPALASLGPARWHLDKETFQKIFDQNYLGMHADAFFVLIRHQAIPIHYDLFWLDAAHAEPVHIPLRFTMDPATQVSLKKLAGLPPKLEGIVDPGLADNSIPFQMTATDAGICLYTASGLWFIPYEDIDAYLKSASK